MLRFKYINSYKTGYLFAFLFKPLKRHSLIGLKKNDPYEKWNICKWELFYLNCGCLSYFNVCFGIEELCDGWIMEKSKRIYNIFTIITIQNYFGTCYSFRAIYYSIVFYPWLLHRIFLKIELPWCSYRAVHVTIHAIFREECRSSANMTLQRVYWVCQVQ